MWILNAEEFKRNLTTNLKEINVLQIKNKNKIFIIFKD